MEPSVAIILINYNGYNDTVECVKSLLEIKYNNYTIYIVDNCSDDVEKISKDNFLNRNAKIIYSNNNYGFSGGNNIAIKDAINCEYDYILLLNNDTTVEPDFLSALIQTAENDESIGIVTGKIYYYYKRKYVWAAGGMYDRKTGLTVQFSGLDKIEFNYERKITFATGCLQLIPSRVIQKVGLMEETYFLYSEDSDYCQKVIDAGFKLMYTPKSVIYHKVSASTGNKSSLQQRYMMRNNLYMIKRYSPTPLIAYLRISWHMFKHIVRGRRDFKPTLEGYIDFIKGKTGKIT